MRLATIENEMKTYVKDLKAIQGMCESLHNKNEQLETNISKLNEVIEKNKGAMQGKSETIINLRRDLHNEHMRAISFEQRLDDIDQSGRENNVGINGLLENNDECLTTRLVRLLNLPNVTEEDINSTYRLGKQREGKVRDVLVKFTSKKKRDLYYAKRKNTPKDDNNMKAFINEDLTPHRSKLFFDARCLVKRKRLHSTWTQEGNVMIKVTRYT